MSRKTRSTTSSVNMQNKRLSHPKGMSLSKLAPFGFDESAPCRTKLTHNSVRRVYTQCFFCQTALQCVRKCARCYAVVYCSPTCQRRDWKTHKAFCNNYTAQVPDRQRKKLGSVSKMPITQAEKKEVETVWDKRSRDQVLVGVRNRNGILELELESSAALLALDLLRDCTETYMSKTRSGRYKCVLFYWDSRSLRKGVICWT